MNRYDKILLEKLSAVTKVKLEDIDLKDKNVIKMFRNNIYGSNNNINHSLLGICECSTEMFNKIAQLTNPHNIKQISKILALPHGTNTWINNAEYLLANKYAKLENIISTPEDVIDFLTKKGIGKRRAETISSLCNKYKSDIGDLILFTNHFKEYDIPDWYAYSLLKISYAYPRTKANELALVVYQLAWFKKYYNSIFYKLLFELDSVITKENLSKENSLEMLEKYHKKIDKINLSFGNGIAFQSGDSYKKAIDLAKLRHTIIMAYTEQNKEV